MFTCSCISDQAPETCTYFRQKNAHYSRHMSAVFITRGMAGFGFDMCTIKLSAEKNFLEYDIAELGPVYE